MFLKVNPMEKLKLLVVTRELQVYSPTQQLTFLPMCSICIKITEIEERSERGKKERD